MVTAYVGLGANLGNPAAQLDAALAELGVQPRISLQRRSRYWRSRAIGPQPQPDYCNAVCSLQTDLEPEALLSILLDLENAAGRTREQRWGPRVLDLDLLHVEGAHRATTRLTLPHPQLVHRPFVLVPLAEVEATLVIPGIGAIASLAAACDRSELQPWGFST